MPLVAPLLAASLLLVQDGRPAVRVEHDGSPPAVRAAAMLRRAVLLDSGIALPEMGAAPAVRITTTAHPGYAIRLADGGAVIEGRDPVRAVRDAIERWRASRDGLPALGESAHGPARALWIDADALDPSLPATGLVVRGPHDHDARVVDEARAHGVRVRVVSETFDDFLPPERFAGHPEWFALRHGERVPRGNFALGVAEARAAYLDALAAWLGAHPGVDAVGLWPEVTIAWDEAAIARGEPEAYALLWREAAARFPDVDIGILATGVTLRPPAGAVPSNVTVRLRPGRDASGLQGLAGQPIEAVVRAWEARGARVVLEIDAQPDSWCGLPWPCHGAIRENAARFAGAVLVGGGATHARAWRDPARDPGLPPAWEALEERARSVTGWGHPSEAAALFVDGLPPAPDGERERWRTAGLLGRVERLVAVAADTAGAGDGARREAAIEAWRGYRELLRRLAPVHAATLRRYRERALRRVVERLFPEGIEERVGPALVRDAFDRVTVETDRLRLGIDRATGAVDGIALRLASDWSSDWTGGDGRMFRVVAPAVEASPVLDSLRVHSPAHGEVVIELGGRFGHDGPRWETRLALASGSGRVHQRARVEAGGGVAAACLLGARPFDRWLCPSWVAEGPLDGGGGERAGLMLPPGALIYLRDGERGPGLALRLPSGGRASLADGDGTTLLAATRRDTLEVEWTLFAASHELALR